MQKLRRMSLLRYSGVLALLGSSGVTVAGCSADKNHDERALVAAPVPQDCVGRCRFDPPPARVDCDAAEAGLEFFPVWDFEADIATALYVYDDNSRNFSQPRSANNNLLSAFEPPTTALPRCIPQQEPGANRTFRLYGGPYRSWGGGVGRRVDQLLTSCGEHCAEVASPTREWPEHTLDLSRWDGISFWARRGIDGQANLRVAIGDKYTDDDINFLQYEKDPNAPRYCERVKECGCRTWSPDGKRKPCSPWVASTAQGMETRYACFDPAVDPTPVAADEVERFGYEECGVSFCSAQYEAFTRPDLQFQDLPCAPYTFRGGIEGNYCYDPVNGPPPPETNAQCGDHWLHSVTLSTEWQFYVVPFTRLLQQNWAKESHYLDLTSVSLLRFTWDRGWADFYIDDVSFYRRVAE